MIPKFYVFYQNFRYFTKLIGIIPNVLGFLGFLISANTKNANPKIRSFTNTISSFLSKTYKMHHTSPNFRKKSNEIIRTSEKQIFAFSNVGSEIQGFCSKCETLLL